MNPPETVPQISDQLYERAQRFLPGGNSRTTVFVEPHPPYALRGEGCYVEDVDGHRTIDLQNNYTALIHGHAHPEVTAVAHKIIDQGASFGLPTEHEIAMAEKLAERIPWANRWRFANSGTEAVMMAIRLARAATGRDGILRFDGAYHGSYDAAMMPSAPGVAAAVAGDIHSVPVGDLAAAEAVLREHGERIACVLFDAMPNRAGLVPATQEFVDGLRAATSAQGVLWLQDEVLTLRVGYGGIHSLYGIEPDIVTVGKVIGGGFPVGGFGGSAELMDRFDPRQTGALSHGGTFSANPVTMAAGAKALDLYDRGEVDRLNALGDRLREGLAAGGWNVTGRGSLVRVHDAADERTWWSLYRAGVLLAGNGLACLSTPMDESVIATVEERFEAARA